MGPYWQRIKAKMKKGMTTGQAVSATLEECQKDAQKILYSCNINKFKLNIEK
jgi:uncharacterized protein YoaH (UPF0181 family)